MSQTIEYIKKIAKSTKLDRVSTIIDILKENNLPYTIQNENNATNIDLSFGEQHQNKLIFLAHHDIANSTLQGANDNTASIGNLITFALFLKNFPCKYNIHIGFVDNEESLGALMSKNMNTKDKLKLVTHIGSYLYLKKMLNSKILAVINLEMSGIGQNLFIANSSGNVECDKNVNSYIKKVCSEANINQKLISISNTDYLSSYICKIPSTVIGTFPNEEFVNRNGYNIPKSWQTMHSNQDTVDKIEQKALDTMELFLQTFIKEITLNQNNF